MTRLAALIGAISAAIIIAVSSRTGAAADRHHLGGDYGAVEKLENRDAAWREKLVSALTDFQKDGQVGKTGENQ